jgi:hypothetical protein
VGEPTVGDREGDAVGERERVGEKEGESVGERLGELVGPDVGVAVGQVPQTGAVQTSQKLFRSETTLVTHHDERSATKRGARLNAKLMLTTLDVTQSDGSPAKRSASSNI